MAQHLMPFGVGTRICGGQNLAQIVLRVALTAFIANFDISANRMETNEKTMEIKDAFVRDFSPIDHAAFLTPPLTYRSSTRRLRNASSCSRLASAKDSPIVPLARFGTTIFPSTIFPSILPVFT